MDEEGLSKDFVQALVDRYTAMELCDLLDIPIRDFIEAFEDSIVDYYDELCEEMGYKEIEDGTESD